MSRVLSTADGRIYRSRDVGSNPTPRPNFEVQPHIIAKTAPVAQLDRVPDF